MTLKGDLEQVLNLTMEMLSDQLGEGSAAAAETAGTAGDKDDELESAYSKPKKKSRWAEPAPILPIKPWQVGENCQALYSGMAIKKIYLPSKIQVLCSSHNIFRGWSVL